MKEWPSKAKDIEKTVDLIIDCMDMNGVDLEIGAHAMVAIVIGFMSRSPETEAFEIFIIELRKMRLKSLNK